MRPDSKENTATNVSWKTNIKGNHCLKHGSDKVRIKKENHPKTNQPQITTQHNLRLRFKIVLGSVWSTTLSSTAALYTRFTNGGKTALVSKQINAYLCSAWLVITSYTPQISEESSQFLTQKHSESFLIFFAFFQALAVFLTHHPAVLNFKKHFFKVVKVKIITYIAKNEKKFNVEYK